MPSERDRDNKKGASLIVTLVAATFFMENLDGTIIATALPHADGALLRRASGGHEPRHHGLPADARGLHPDLRLGRRPLRPAHGVRQVFGSAIAVFTAASVLCATTSTLPAFAAARVLQDIGGAMMVPVGRLAVLRATPKEGLMRAIAIITWPGLVAPVIGPPLGGFITTYSSWRWIFYLNVPLGRNDADWRFVGLLVAVGALAGFASWRHLRRAAHPVVDLSALKVKTFAVAMGGGSLFRIAISAAPFLLPLMFQVGFGMNPFESDLLTLAVFARNLSMKLVTTPVMRRFGFRPVLIVNGVLAALSLAAMSLLTPTTPKLVIVVLLFASGLSRSLQFTALNTLSFADVPKTR